MFALALLAFARQAKADTTTIYQFTDLGTLGGASSAAWDINAAGQVVGEANTASGTDHAFVYSGGVLTDLGTLGGQNSVAYGINGAGQIVGNAAAPGGATHAFIYSSGAMTDLGTLGSTYSSAWDVNSSSQVTGYSYTADGDAHAFLYSGGTMSDLGTLGGATSVANGVNASGQVAGYSLTSGGIAHAFLDSGGTMTDLGTLGGTTSTGVGINDAGQVVGAAATAGNAASHAFLYSGGSMTDLGTLGGANSQAYSVNAAGQVVGEAQTSAGLFDAFLYSSGTMTDLNTLLDDSASGWTLVSANAINDSGSIVGSGVNSSGSTHAFLLTPLSAFTWTNAGATGSWQTAMSWLPDGGPDNAGEVVIFAPTSPLGTVTLDGGPTIGVLQFNNGASGSGMTIAAGNSGGTLTLDSGIAGSTATISVTAGQHTISAPLVLNQSVGISITTAATGTGLTISGPISDGVASSGISLAGGGTLTLSATNTYSGGTTIAGGRLITTAAGTLGSGPVSVAAGGTLALAGSVSAMSQSMNVANSGSLLVCGSAAQTIGTVTGPGNTVVSGSLSAYQIRQNSLTIGSGAMVTLFPSGSGSTTNPTGPNNINFSSTLSSLAIAGTMNAWTGTLDIGNNGLVIAYGSGTDPYAMIDNMIESGFNAAHWTGTGITSSLAAAATDSKTPLNIGLIDFTPGAGIYSNTTFISFEGQTVTTGAVLLRLTYMDDINMNGDMTPEDAAGDALIFAANVGSGTTWSVGDLAHEGLVNSTDALLFAANYVTGLPQLDGTMGNAAMLGGSAGQRPVPEPASVALAIVGAMGLRQLARRRRRE